MVTLKYSFNKRERERVDYGYLQTKLCKVSTQKTKFAELILDVK